MRLQRLSADGAVVELSRLDLVLVVNALNFVSNAVDLPQFATLFGAERDTADHLLAGMKSVLEDLDADREP